VLTITPVIVFFAIFFLLRAPLVGLTYKAWESKWITILISIILLFTSLPYVFLNNTRPILGMAPDRTRVGSIFAEPMSNLMFANVKHLQYDYYAIRDAIQEGGCNDVGLHVSAGNASDLFWWIFHTPQSGERLEVLKGLHQLTGYMDPEFQLCSIICTDCSEIDRTHDFRRGIDYGRARLFF